MWTAAWSKPVMKLQWGNCELLTGAAQLWLCMCAVHCFSACFIPFLPTKAAGMAHRLRHLDLLEGPAVHILVCTSPGSVSIHVVV